MQVNFIFFKLLDKFTRIRSYGFMKNTNSFIHSPSHEILHKRAFLNSKIWKNCVHGKFPHQETGRKRPHLTQCGNPLYILHEFHGTNLQECIWESAKVSYSCTEKMKSVNNAQYTKLLFENINTVPPCNCRIKSKCDLI